MKRVLVAFLVLGLASCSSLTDLHGIRGSGGDANAALEDGVRRLLEQPAIGFQYSVETSTEEFSVAMSGTVEPDREAWAAEGRLTTTAPGDAELFELRSIRQQRWLGLSFHPGAASCWVEMSDDRELEGLPSIDAGFPGFVSVLTDLRSAEWQLGDRPLLTARLALPDAALLASTFKLTTSELAPREDTYGAVRVTVGLQDGILHDVSMIGGELASEYERVGAELSDEAAADLETRDMRLTFGGPTHRVRAPDPARVYDGVHRVPGCPKPESESANA